MGKDTIEKELAENSVEIIYHKMMEGIYTIKVQLPTTGLEEKMGKVLMRLINSDMHLDLKGKPKIIENEIQVGVISRHTDYGFDGDKYKNSAIEKIRKGMNEAYKEALTPN